MTNQIAIQPKFVVTCGGKALYYSASRNATGHAMSRKNDDIAGATIRVFRASEYDAYEKGLSSKIPVPVSTGMREREVCPDYITVKPEVYDGTVIELQPHDGNEPEAGFSDEYKNFCNRRHALEYGAIEGEEYPAYMVCGKWPHIASMYTRDFFERNCGMDKFDHPYERFCERFHRRSDAVNRAKWLATNRCYHIMVFKVR